MRQKAALRNEFLTRAVVILVALCAPFVYYAFRTNEVSISEFWHTPLQPLFIFTNAATSYFFFSTEKWKPSAILLLLLTAFSVDKYFLAHNIFAVTFFLYNIIPLISDRRLHFYAAPYIFSLTLVNWPDIFHAEMVAITVLCLFHAHLMGLKWVAAKKRRNSQIKNSTTT